MDTQYNDVTRVKISRILPDRPNLCRISAFVNALNYFQYTDKNNKKIDQETLLTILNNKRVSRGQVPYDVDKDYVAYSDLEEFLDEINFIRVKTRLGGKHLNKDLILKLIEHGCLISIEHQELYNYNHTSFAEVSDELITKLIKNPEFSYELLLKFYDEIIDTYGPLEEGHTDLVLDVRNIEGNDHIIFANLNFKNDEHYVKLPWNLFCNYVAIDWENCEPLKSSWDLPDKENFEKLRTEGFLPDNTFNSFIYGYMKIFYKPELESKVQLILSNHDDATNKLW